jgi:hypothetical protein
MNTHDHRPDSKKNNSRVSMIEMQVVFQDVHAIAHARGVAFVICPGLPLVDKATKLAKKMDMNITDLFFWIEISRVRGREIERQQ